MSEVIDYCIDCGKQVLGAPICNRCFAQAQGLTIVHCRECDAEIMVRDMDQADVASLMCDPCERHLRREMMSPMPYDSPFTGGFDGQDELYYR